MGKIYKITNLVDGKCYVGKTIKPLEERLRGHLYEAKYRSERYLHRAMRAHGSENFIIDLVEETEDLDNAERFWISYLDAGYNMTAGGEGGDTSSSPAYQAALANRNQCGANNGMYGKRGKDNPNYGKKYGPRPEVSKKAKERWANTEWRALHDR